jgi:hypothetical protein
MSPLRWACTDKPTGNGDFFIRSLNFLYITLHWTFSISCHTHKTPIATIILYTQLSSSMKHSSIMEKLKIHTCSIFIFYSLSTHSLIIHIACKNIQLSLSLVSSIFMIVCILFKADEIIIFQIWCGMCTYCEEYWNSIREDGKMGEEKIQIYLSWVSEWVRGKNTKILLLCDGNCCAAAAVECDENFKVLTEVECWFLVVGNLFMKSKSSIKIMQHTK